MLLNTTFKICRIRSVPAIQAIGIQGVRRYADDAQVKTKVENASIKPQENFINRNPRNLERLAYAVKDFGWGMEGIGYSKSKSTNLPKRTYYHRLILTRSKYHSYAEVEHVSGNVVVSASTKEWCIRRHLYKNTDVSACINLGRIIALRCLRSGISCVSFGVPEMIKTESEAVDLFREALEEEGLCLEEPSHVRLVYTLPHQNPTGPAPPKYEGPLEPFSKSTTVNRPHLSTPLRSEYAEGKLSEYKGIMNK